MTRIILAGFIASIVWFAAATILYMNPYSKKIADTLKNHPGVKKWANQKEMLLPMYLWGVLVPSIIFAVIFWWLNPVFPSSILAKTILFGLILVGIKIYPRLTDTALMTSYPKQLLIMDFINGTISSFVIAAAFAFLI